MLGLYIVDGGSLAPPRGPKVLYFLGLLGLQVMQDFLQQQYFYWGGVGIIPRTLRRLQNPKP